jgi:hypothetical protein
MMIDQQTYRGKQNLVSSFQPRYAYVTNIDEGNLVSFLDRTPISSY